MTERLYWPSWFLAAVLTGIVAGFMLGHALILARFVDWLLLAGAPALSQAYPAFRATAGRTGPAGCYWPGAATPTVSPASTKLIPAKVRPSAAAVQRLATTRSAGRPRQRVAG